MKRVLNTLKRIPFYQGLICPIKRFVVIILLSHLWLIGCKDKNRNIVADATDINPFDPEIIQRGKSTTIGFEALSKDQFDVAIDNFLVSHKISWKHKLYNSSESKGLCSAYIEQGKYAEAAALMEETLKKNKAKRELNDIIWDYAELGDIYLDQGDLTKALINYNKSLEYSKQIKTQYLKSGLKQFRIYGSLVHFLMEQGNYEQAIIYSRERLDARIKVGALPKDISISKNELGSIYYFYGDYEAAENLFREAAGLNENVLVTFEQDLAKSLRMLGKIEEKRNKYENALEFYHSALDVLRRPDFPGYRVEQADLLMEIGRFQLLSGNFIESRIAYDQAIQYRKDTTTDLHPNYADALRGLAGTEAIENNLTSATCLVMKSLEILDKALVPTHSRIAPALVAMGSIHALAGRLDQVGPLNERIETILQKPLGPWKEDFLETTKFYAELLKKAGRPEEAERLEQLYARQKDRR